MSSPTSLAVLVAPRPGTPRPPQGFVIGRAALALRERGVRVVFGHRTEQGRASGLVATRQGWQPTDDVPVVAAQDRLAGRAQDAIWRAALAGLAGLPVGNPASMKLLTRDKLSCQRRLEAAGLKLPEVESDPALFEARLADWGAAFLKPRRGSLGIGVTRVLPGDDLARPGGPWLLQRGVGPAPGGSWIALRLLAQREPEGGWLLCEPVARVDPADPVVNVERGASVAPGSAILAPTALRRLRDQAAACCDALADGPDGEQAVEAGIDFVLDRDGMPWLIEVNSVPRGRLGALAALDTDRWGAAQEATAIRPLLRLLALGA